MNNRRARINCFTWDALWPLMQDGQPAASQRVLQTGRAACAGHRGQGESSQGLAKVNKTPQTRPSTREMAQPRPRPWWPRSTSGQEVNPQGSERGLARPPPFVPLISLRGLVPVNP